jgi:DNA processing protein
LSQQILALGGALISEFAIGTFAAPQNFPRRNRILSGMSVGVLVVEAAEYSGTRIAAGCALEQNRDGFAVPGNVTNKNSWGPNTLIKQGAKLVATWEDMWEDLSPEVKLALTPPLSLESEGGSSASLFPDEGLPPHEKRILSLLKPTKPRTSDELVERLETEMSSSEIFAALFELELTGKVRQMPGKNFVKSFSLLAFGLWLERIVSFKGVGFMRNYKDLRVWDEARKLTLAVYRTTHVFPKEERFGLTSQVRTSIDLDCSKLGGRLWQEL